MHCSDGTGMLLCIAAEVLLVAGVFLGGKPDAPSDSGSSLSAETTVTSTVSESDALSSLTTTTTASTAVTSVFTTTETTVTTTETTETTTTETTVTILPRVLSDVTLAEVCEPYQFPDNAEELLSDTVFIGDSITLGLKTYRIVPADHVLARGGCGVRNVLEQDYLVENQRVDLLEALEILHPRFVSFAFGMNDLHMSSTEEYCENYRRVLTAVQEVLPYARLIVLPTTPVLAGIDFTTNDTVDKYNAALRDFAEESALCTFIDITPELKNEWNSLKAHYQSGDGIHLTPKGYAPYLMQFCTGLDAALSEPQKTETASGDPEHTETVTTASAHIPQT